MCLSSEVRSDFRNTRPGKRFECSPLVLLCVSLLIAFVSSSVAVWYRLLTFAFDSHNFIEPRVSIPSLYDLDPESFIEPESCVCTPSPAFSAQREVIVDKRDLIVLFTFAKMASV